jgi:hypothetical protein
MSQRALCHVVSTAALLSTLIACGGGGGSASSPEGGSGGATGHSGPCFDSPCAGTCKGTTCAGAWTCDTSAQACTSDIAEYCGCDGQTFEDSGSCPTRAFASRGACASGPVSPGR